MPTRKQAPLSVAATVARHLVLLAAVVTQLVTAEAARAASAVQRGVQNLVMSQEKSGMWGGSVDRWGTAFATRLAEERGRDVTPAKELLRSRPGAPPVAVPGVTGTKNPRGTSARINVSSEVPPDARTSAASASSSNPSRNSVSATIPPAFCPQSPYPRPSPRAMNPRAPALATSASISLFDTGCATSAALDGLRPHPVTSR